MCVMGRVPQLMSVWRQPWVSAGICFVCYRCDGLKWVTWGKADGRVYKVTGGLLV